MPLVPLPTATEEPEPPGLIATDELPPGPAVVVPLSPPAPVVIDVEFVPSSLRVTIRHGWPLTITVPSEPDATATLSAKAGVAAASKPMASAQKDGV